MTAYTIIHQNGDEIRIMIERESITPYVSLVFIVKLSFPIFQLKMNLTDKMLIVLKLIKAAWDKRKQIVRLERRPAS